jgi:pyrophosphatase PpaX
MYDAVLFDFDGTLIASLDYWFEGFRHALEQLGHNLDEETIIAKCFYKNDTEIAKTFGLDCHKSFWQLVQGKLVDCYGQAELFPGVVEVLEMLALRQIPVGIVTSAERVLVEKALNHLPIRRHFQTIITYDDVENLKPSPEPILKALSALNIQPSRTLYIGDYLVDIAAGKAAGTATGVFHNHRHSRFHKRSDIVANKPDFIFDDYELLQAHLDEVLSPRDNLASGKNL